MPEATSLPPSILLSSLPSHGLPGGLVRARSPAAKRFAAVYTVKQPYKYTMPTNTLGERQMTMWERRE